jgi:hypothetical protein
LTQVKALLTLSFTQPGDNLCTSEREVGGNKMFFKKRSKNPQTRIVRRMTDAEVLGRATASPLRSPIASVLHSRTFEVNTGDFNGFESPPGRF